MSSWFSLPLPRPDPTTLPDEASSSDPDWLLNRNFKNRLHFEPWNSLQREVVAVRRDLSRLKKTSEARREIESLLKPVRKELEDEGWQGCWNESAVERQVAVQVWRAVNVAREAVLSIRKRQDVSSELYFVPQREVRSEQYVKRVGNDLGISVKISNPEHIIPDFCCFAKASDSRNNKSPLATVELKGSQAKLIPDHRDGSSPQKVADYCSSVFARKPVKDALGEHFHVAKRLSQALTQAFHTESGSGVLYNHVYALFFYIEGKKRLKTGRVRVVVKMSRVYRCDTFPSNLHAFTAWTFVMEKLVALRASTRKQQLLDAIEYVSTSSREHEDDDDSPPSSSSEEPTSPPNTPSSDDVSSPEKKRQKGNGGQKNGGKKKGSSTSSKKRPLALLNIEQLRPHATSLSKRISESLETSLAMSGIEDARVQLESWRNDDLVRRTLDSDIDILGEGAFGVVRRALVNGVQGAIKYRNRCVVGTHQYLCNEIVMYCHIASRYPQLLNYSVPNLIAVGFDEWVGPVLITEVVGEDVYVSEGCLNVGNEQLHPEMSLLVCEAAINCLRALHQCGILHRDVALRNLRARITLPDKGSHDVEELKMDGCVAWWIDLGFSKIGGSRREFDFELEQCASMFGACLNQQE